MFLPEFEQLLGSLLIAGAMVVSTTNVHRVLEADLFAVVLLLQSVPFWSAVGVAAFERIPNRKRGQTRISPKRIVAAASAFSFGLCVWVGAHAHDLGHSSPPKSPWRRGGPTIPKPQCDPSARCSFSRLNPSGTHAG